MYLLSLLIVWYLTYSYAVRRYEIKDALRSAWQVTPLKDKIKWYIEACLIMTIPAENVIVTIYIHIKNRFK